MEKEVRRGLLYWINNPLSAVGVSVALVGLSVFVFLVVILQTFFGDKSPYTGLITYMVVPVLIILGLVLIAVGAVWTWRRRVAGKSTRFPIIDFNEPRHRRETLALVIGGLIFVLLTAFGSYQAYEYTESVRFCGQVCHKVMHPEFVTYQHSPHARVGCVECHVGPGAGWYVRSKLSGLYQVYATVANVYPQPIPTPIESLRPARETCEECHWPEQFFGAQEKVLVHYLPDEANTEWTIRLLIKIGGGHPATGLTSGIHWHMNTANQVEYRAVDKQRQIIPWVRSTNRLTGEVSTFVSTEDPPEEGALGELRQMDCMDCHNRPTHIFQSPARVVNTALLLKRLDRSLPSIKRIGVEVLSTSYGSTSEALEGISEGVRAFYASEYPEVYRTRRSSIQDAVTVLQELYRQSIFPEMKARWDVYPDHIGHLYFPGCYRCHDGKHQREDGREIFNDCRTCHTVLAQGPSDALSFASGAEGLDFVHPEDIDKAWKEMGCYECHTGGP